MGSSELEFGRHFAFEFLGGTLPPLEYLQKHDYATAGADSRAEPPLTSQRSPWIHREAAPLTCSILNIPFPARASHIT